MDDKNDFSDKDKSIEKKIEETDDEESNILMKDQTHYETPIMKAQNQEDLEDFMKPTRDKYDPIAFANPYDNTYIPSQNYPKSTNYDQYVDQMNQQTSHLVQYGNPVPDLEVNPVSYQNFSSADTHFTTVDLKVKTQMEEMMNMPRHPVKKVCPFCQHDDYTDVTKDKCDACCNVFIIFLKFVLFALFIAIILLIIVLIVAAICGNNSSSSGNCNHHNGCDCIIICGPQMDCGCGDCCDACFSDCGDGPKAKKRHRCKKCRKVIGYCKN
eukprot:403334654